MQRFHVKKDIDRRGFEWSGQYISHCPYCNAKNKYYYRLTDNCCKYCHVEMPFPSKMVTDMSKRIQYHFEV